MKDPSLKETSTDSSQEGMNQEGSPPIDAALVAEIVRELRKDLLKRRVASELEKDNWFKSTSKFFQHPAVLLAIGFVTTGVIGAGLANRWQSREWNRQQSLQSQEWERQQLRQIDIHGIDLKYNLIDEITKAIGERNASALGMVMPLLDGNSDQEMLKQEQEPIKNWQRVTNEWRVNSQVLKQKLTVHIEDSKAVEAFERVITKEIKIGAEVSGLRDNLRQYNRESDEDAQKYLQGILNEIRQTGEDLKSLAAIIATETRNDVKKNSR